MILSFWSLHYTRAAHSFQGRGDVLSWDWLATCSIEIFGRPLFVAGLRMMPGSWASTFVPMPFLQHALLILCQNRMQVVRPEIEYPNNRT